MYFTSAAVAYRTLIAGSDLKWQNFWFSYLKSDRFEHDDHAAEGHYF